MTYRYTASDDIALIQLDAYPSHVSDKAKRIVREHIAAWALTQPEPQVAEAETLEILGLE